MLHVRENYVRGRTGTPKSGRSRDVPLTPDAVSALRAYQHDRALVFCHPDGSHLSHVQARYRLGSALRAAKLAPSGWHKLRHTYASHLAMADVQLLAIKELLGHSDTKETQIYAHLSPSHLATKVVCLDRRPSTTTSSATSPPTASLTALPLAA